MITQEGDRIGLVRKSNGHLHYFINGLDQGMASSNSPSPVWGVVDLYGMAVKVSITDQPPVEPLEGAAAASPLPPSVQHVEGRNLGNMLRQFLDTCEGGDGLESQSQPVTGSLFLFIK